MFKIFNYFLQQKYGSYFGHRTTFWMLVWCTGDLVKRVLDQVIILREGDREVRLVLATLPFGHRQPIGGSAPSA
jgi:hypothetical protein